MNKIDQRKTASADTNLKKAEAGRKGKGRTAFVKKVNKSKEDKLQERIELVVQMALKAEGRVNSEDMVLHNRRVLWSRMRATKIA